MTHLRNVSSIGLAGLALALVGGRADAQVFVRNSTDIPDQTGSQNRYTENVDFADVDLDGDFDAAFARGGDFGNIQDQIWINNGGLQGGTIGVFSDQTAARFPAIARDGRDIEFVDFDNDGDQDLYISNTSTNSNQTNQWFVNDGGLQGGSLGFYTDETAARWVGLGGAGSSIAPSQLIGGGFIDWSCDCDFGDLDNDGDMDLVHSTYGGNFNGQVPTRIFLNDGAGHFAEFNPSGFQLAGSSIANGNPGLWCEGNMQSNTSNTTGANCDIATNTLDIDLGDIDGDFDLDILHGDRSNLTRFFYNRLEENGGTLAFRDVTNYVYPANWSDGEGHYEQEMGDFDGDCDLDLYGLNWRAGGFDFDDNVMENVGGRFSNQVILPGSSSDDNEGDWGDYDNDGDLDLYVANFSGTDKLYSNNGSGTLSILSNAASGLNNFGGGSNSSLDADWCDVDEDGDYDVWAARDVTRTTIFWENTTGTPDTTAPKVDPVEVLGNNVAGIAGSPDRAVRAHVYDNAPYYITWYNPTEVEVWMGALKLDSFPARASGGQVFRAEIPSNLVGNITYLFVSRDQYGNQGSSVGNAYTATTALNYQTVYGTPALGPGGAEYTLTSSGILTPGKPWYAITNTGTFNFYLLAITLAPTAPIADPLLGVTNLDFSQPAWLSAQGTGGTGLGRVKFFLDEADTWPSIPVYLQSFIADPGMGIFYGTRGLEVPIIQ